MEATGGGVAASRAFAAELCVLIDGKEETRDVNGSLMIAAEAGKPRAELESCDLFVKEFPFVREVFRSWAKVELNKITELNGISVTGDNPVTVYVRPRNGGNATWRWTVVGDRSWGEGTPSDEIAHLSAMKQMELRKLGIDIE